MFESPSFSTISVQAENPQLPPLLVSIHTDEIWKIPASGGEETLVMKGIGLGELGIVVRWHLLYERGRRAHSFLSRVRHSKDLPLVSLEKPGVFPSVAPMANPLSSHKLT